MKVDASQLFAEAHDVAGWRAGCAAAASGYRSTARSFGEVLEHLAEGLKFYMALQVSRGVPSFEN